MQHHLSIVIPCYNEEQSIPSFFVELRQFQTEFKSTFPQHRLSVVVVNNASTDSSSEKLQQESDTVHIVECRQQGYGAALKYGFSWAQENLKPMHYGFCDLDSTYPLMAFTAMYGLVLAQNLDMVFASRMNTQSGMPLLRKFGNRIYVLLCKILFKSKLSDVCTGQRIFKESRVPEVLSLKTNQLNFSIDLTACALKKRWSYQEVPIIYEKRTGSSKLSIIRDGISFLLTLLKWLGKK